MESTRPTLPTLPSSISESTPKMTVTAEALVVYWGGTVTLAVPYFLSVLIERERREAEEEKGWVGRGGKTWQRTRHEGLEPGWSEAYSVSEDPPQPVYNNIQLYGQ